MTDTDYKAALELVNEGFLSFPSSNDEGSAILNATIQEALRIAERVRSGEVSEGMLDVGKTTYKAYTSPFVRNRLYATYKAMTQKLLEEMRGE